MYLKLEIDGEESFHSFPDQDRVSVGRSPMNDIQVMAEGISRNHLEIHVKAGGEFFAIDKGSTHGTFINEEQLTKDTPVVFNTFFPARLGTSVFIYLMDAPVDIEEAAAVVVEEEPIKKSSLDDFFQEEAKPQKKKPQMHVPSTAGKMTKDMQNVMKKKEELIPAPKARRKKVSKKAGSKKTGKKTAKKKDNSQKMITIIGVFLAIAFAGYNQWQKMEEAKRAVLAKKLKAQQAIVAAQKEEEKRLELERQAKLKAEALQKQKEFVKTVVDRDKCLADIEITFCNSIRQNITRTYKEGAVKELSTLYIILDVNHKNSEYDNYKYSDDELKEVIKHAKRSVGRRFHEGYFVARKDARLDELKPSFENNNIKVFADFMASMGDSFPQETEDLKKIVVVAIENDVYSSHYEYSIEKLKQADLSKMKFDFIMLLRSNVKSPMRKLLNDFKFE